MNTASRRTHSTLRFFQKGLLALLVVPSLLLPLVSVANPPAGMVWGTATILDDYGQFRDLIFANNEFLAVTSVSPNLHVLASRDGSTWTRVGTIPVRSSSRGHLAFGNGRYVYQAYASECSPDRFCVFTSSDRVAWTKTVIPGSRLEELYDLKFGSGVFVATGETSIDPPFVNAMTSSDGLTWTDVLNTSTHTGAGFSYTSDELQYLDGKFLARGKGGDAASTPGIWMSSDGQQWQFYPGQPSAGCANGTFGRGVAYGRGLFIAPQTAKHCESLDGSSWVSTNNNLPSGDVHDITYTAGQFFVTGWFAGTKAYSSIDAVNWTLEPTPGSVLHPEQIESSGSGRVVLLGDSGDNIIYGVSDRVFQDGFQ